MAARGYTTATLVAKELGRDLTAPQLDQCADLIEQAEAWIDHESGRAWMVASPTTDELITVTGPVVYLGNRPVSAISSVKVRPMAVGGADTTLVAGTDYELVDGQNGILLLSGFLGPGGDIIQGTLASNSYLKVSYTSATPVPGDIQRGATLLVAHWMLPRLEPDRQGVDSYSIGGELQVKVSKADIPDEVLRLIHGHESMAFA